MLWHAVDRALESLLSAAAASCLQLLCGVWALWSLLLPGAPRSHQSPIFVVVVRPIACATDEGGLRVYSPLAVHLWVAAAGYLQLL